MKFIVPSSKYGDKEVLIDDEDWERIKKYRWFIWKHHNKFYVMSTIYNKITKETKNFSLHRLIMNFPKNMQINHIDGNGLNNQKNNLRVCTQAENLRNSKKSKNNTSGYKGVSYNKYAKKYDARIMIDHKQIFLGNFKTLELAYVAYCKASKKYHGKFGRVE